METISWDRKKFNKGILKEKGRKEKRDKETPKDVIKKDYPFIIWEKAIHVQRGIHLKGGDVTALPVQYVVQIQLHRKIYKWAKIENKQDLEQTWNCFELL